jgi:endonuclease/exonuclease/phosphatase family metal-dependent hydrolase
MERMKYATWNTRIPSINQDSEGIRHWDTVRRAKCMDLIRALQPDILGLQEVQDRQAFRQDLPQFELIEGYEMNPNQYNSVLFNPKKLLLEAWQGIWHNELEIPGQTAVEWNAKDPRTSTLLVMNNVQTGKPFCFVNTHYDFTLRPQYEQTRQLLRTIDQITGNGQMPCMVVGDFNAENGNYTPSGLKIPRTDGMEGVAVKLFEKAGFKDAYSLLHPNDSTTNSFQAFMKKDEYLKEGINNNFGFLRPDQVLVRGFDVESCNVVQTEHPYASDHFPVSGVVYRYS